MWDLGSLPSRFNSEVEAPRCYLWASLPSVTPKCMCVAARRMAGPIKFVLMDVRGRFRFEPVTRDSGGGGAKNTNKTMTQLCVLNKTENTTNMRWRVKRSQNETTRASSHWKSKR